MEQEQGTPWTQ
ncbi:PB1-F2 protein [Influenza A virus]|nr:PB1-F2 protein [Influenza A virus]BCD40312.1 PB1-F2 protein [Influenza A virus]